MESIVEMTTYHVGLREHLDDFMTVKDRHIHRPYPAWSAIGISELITRERSSSCALSRVVRTQLATRTLHLVTTSNPGLTRCRL